MDCYSLGVMLFVMLVGSKPMSQDQVQGMKYAWLQPEQLRNMHVCSHSLIPPVSSAGFLCGTPKQSSSSTAFAGTIGANCSCAGKFSA
jgi:hypothetical protein